LKLDVESSNSKIIMPLSRHFTPFMLKNGKLQNGATFTMNRHLKMVPLFVLQNGKSTFAISKWRHFTNGHF
jgi:hypothetical protein